MDNMPLTQEQAEEFIRLWQRMPGASVARVFKMSRQRAHQIADKLAEAGVPLRNRKSPFALRETLDIGRLIQVAMQAEESK